MPALIFELFAFPSESISLFTSMILISIKKAKTSGVDIIISYFDIILILVTIIAIMLLIVLCL